MENKKFDTLSVLKSSFLFRGLSLKDIQELAQKTRFYSHRTGHILIEEDVVNDKIIFIFDGLVKVYKLTPDGREVFLAIEKAGNFLGVMDLEDKPGSATIETLTPTKTLTFHKKDLIALLGKYPILWERMYRIILAKLEEMKKLDGIRIGNDLQRKTYLVLQFLATLSGKNEILLSQETVAGIIGATRPRVTETLQILKKEKKITLSPKKITLLP